MDEEEFISTIQKLNIEMIRHSKKWKKNKESRSSSGSGSFAISSAISSNADALITADLKYHDFSS